MEAVTIVPKRGIIAGGRGWARPARARSPRAGILQVEFFLLPSAALCAFVEEEAYGHQLARVRRACQLRGREACHCDQLGQHGPCQHAWAAVRGARGAFRGRWALAGLDRRVTINVLYWSCSVHVGGKV